MDASDNKQDSSKNLETPYANNITVHKIPAYKLEGIHMAHDNVAQILLYKIPTQQSLIL